MAPTHTTGKHRVLVVDDDRDCADSTGELLRLSCDWEVDVAYGPVDALMQAVARPPDVVLLDLEMPGMDGFDAAGCLFDVLPSNVPRLVALTGNPKLQQRAAADPRFAGALLKPVHRSSFRTLLEGFVDADVRVAAH